MFSLNAADVMQCYELMHTVVLLQIGKSSSCQSPHNMLNVIGTDKYVV